MYVLGLGMSGPGVSHRGGSRGSRRLPRQPPRADCRDQTQSTMYNRYDYRYEAYDGYEYFHRAAETEREDTPVQ